MFLLCSFLLLFVYPVIINVCICLYYYFFSCCCSFVFSLERTPVGRKYSYRVVFCFSYFTLVLFLALPLIYIFLYQVIYPSFSFLHVSFFLPNFVTPYQNTYLPSYLFYFRLISFVFHIFSISSSLPIFLLFPPCFFPFFLSNSQRSRLSSYFSIYFILVYYFFCFLVCISSLFYQFIYPYFSFLPPFFVFSLPA